MGQKVHPNGFRLGVIRDWHSKWFATGAKYAASLVSDQEVRTYLRSKLVNAAVSRVELVRPGGNLIVTIYTGRPGIVIGKKGEDIERLRKGLMNLTGGPVQISVEEIRKPELDANLGSREYLPTVREANDVSAGNETGSTKFHAPWSTRS